METKLHTADVTREILVQIGSDVHRPLVRMSVRISFRTEMFRRIAIENRFHDDSRCSLENGKDIQPSDVRLESTVDVEIGS